VTASDDAIAGAKLGIACALTCFPCVTNTTGPWRRQLHHSTQITQLSISDAPNTFTIQKAYDVRNCLGSLVSVLGETYGPRKVGDSTVVYCGDCCYRWSHRCLYGDNLPLGDRPIKCVVDTYYTL
jgi:hypothetical protein